MRKPSTERPLVVMSHSVVVVAGPATTRFSGRMNPPLGFAHCILCGNIAAGVNVADVGYVVAGPEAFVTEHPRHVQAGHKPRHLGSCPRGLSFTDFPVFGIS